MIGVNELIKIKPIWPQQPSVILMVHWQWWVCWPNGLNQTEEQGFYLCLQERKKKMFFFSFSFPLDINKTAARPSCHWQPFWGCEGTRLRMNQNIGQPWRYPWLALKVSEQIQFFELKLNTSMAKMNGCVLYYKSMIEWLDLNAIEGK